MKGLNLEAWAWLFMAGLAEIAWASLLKYSDGFVKLKPSVLAVIMMLLSFWMLSKALKTLPLSSAYAIWTGIGIAGTAIFGIAFLNEPKTILKLAFTLLILIGIIGLRWVD